MKFRTELSPRKLPFQLTHKDKLLFVGSCFSEHIGNCFQRLGFDSLLNPYGVLFNPLSITANINRSITLGDVQSNELIFQNDRWHHWLLHGSFGALTEQLLSDEIHRTDLAVNRFLQQASVLFVTLGSAWVYEHLDSGIVVGNCHKVPQSQFLKKMLSLEDVTNSLESLITNAHKVNPALQVVITVSPVKHLRDGLVENSMSKSVLLLAANSLTTSIDKVHYFPSYELITEDLRDYRYYEEDMAHPNEQAQAYVWEKLSLAVFSDAQLALNSRLEKLLERKNHRPLFPESNESIAFADKLKADLTQLFGETGIRI